MKKAQLFSILILTIWLAGCGSDSAQPIALPTQKIFTFENTVVSLTFDDGDADNYDVRPILAENDIHGTFYIVSGFTGTDGYMTEDQLRGLHEDGNEIGGHTLDHRNLMETRGEELKRQVCENRSDLMALGFDVVSFAYPYGHYDDESKQVVKDCGFSNARAVSGGPESVPPGDAYTLRAMPYIVTDVDVSKMIRYARGVEKEGGGWVIYVFHHVCDNCDQYSVDIGTFTEFVFWLKEAEANGLVVKTVGEVIEGGLNTGIAP
jgi:peptidoglycan/xylan/chitin deacetylase (PgdA/CDA1 family)